MGKLAQATSKYTVYAKFDADGTVEKPDVIGAVFGQTEGLLGPDLDLRELQRTGRIGRIDVELNTRSGKTSGVITIPSSLDSSETALIAACMETIERVGPCNAKIRVDKVEDVRISKRKYVIERAKELLSKIFEEGQPESQEMSEQIKEAVRTNEIVKYKGLPAGPSLDTYDAVVVVEGRADVVNLLRCGIKNVIAMEGTSVSQPIIDLSKQKITTVFLDGDRGGDLILKELSATCDLDFVTRAPRGKEVEDLTKKEIFKALREKMPYDQAKSENGKSVNRPVRTERKKEYEKREPAKKKRQFSIDPEKTKKFKGVLEDLIGTRAACLLNQEMDILGKVPVKEMGSAIRQVNAKVLIFDGDVDQKLIDHCSRNGIEWIVAMKISGRIHTKDNMTVVTLPNLK